MISCENYFQTVSCIFPTVQVRSQHTGPHTAARKCPMRSNCAFSATPSDWKLPPSTSIVCTKHQNVSAS